MWKLANFKTVYHDNGCDTKAYDKYLIRNGETDESKWVDRYEYNQFIKLGLISK